MPMNKVVKRLWIEALRSGNYEQGPFALERGAADALRHCCLGVLCRVAINSGIDLPVSRELQDDAYTAFGDSGNTSVLPSEVIDWAGLDRADPSVDAGDGLRALSYLNDQGTPFAKIADLIDKSL